MSNTPRTDAERLAQIEQAGMPDGPKQVFRMTHWHCGGEQIFYGNEIVVLKSEYDRLRAHAAALAKDAERYRWLRTKMGAAYAMFWFDPTDNVTGAFTDEIGRPVELDAAIDAALAKEGK